MWLSFFFFLLPYFSPSFVHSHISQCSYCNCYSFSDSASDSASALYLQRSQSCPTIGPFSFFAHHCGRNSTVSRTFAVIALLATATANSTLLNSTACTIHSMSLCLSVYSHNTQVNANVIKCAYVCCVLLDNAGN